VVSGRLKRRIVIAAVVLGVAGLGGTALATSSSSGNSFLDDVAHRLGITPAKLQSAINGAQADRLNQLVKQGKLTRAEAKAIEKRLQQRNGAPLAGPFGGPFGGFRHHGFRGGPHPFFGFGPMGSLQSAAAYLGISPAALGKDLRAGKTFAAIAKESGKSVRGLEAALLAPAKAHLDSAVKAGRLSKSQERKFLTMLSGGIDRLVTKGFRFGGPMHHGWDGEHGMQNGARPAPSAFGL
jgi:polyhydroxyalkanoate synthesis regulator phasin